jgi:CRISPR-associated protein Csc1
MSKAIPLNQHGIRLFACRLYNHDYLWFSSTEISKLSATLPVLHNYALSYALANYSYGVYVGSVPRYFEDLEQIPLYATPARAETFSKTRITYNAMNDFSLRTDDGAKGINTPDLGKRIYLNPVFQRGGDTHSKGYQCYLFTFDDSAPRGVIRLGKKGSTVRVLWQEIAKPLAVFQEKAITPSHPVNPLDISGDVISYDPISLPPHLLFRLAVIKNDWFIFQQYHAILLPKRIRERL